MDEEKETFETALGKLERLVSGMESGRQGMDEMLRSFEEGRRLVKFCTDELASVKTRIEKVVKAADGTAARVEEASFA